VCCGSHSPARETNSPNSRNQPDTRGEKGPKKGGPGRIWGPSRGPDEPRKCALVTGKREKKIIQKVEIRKSENLLRPDLGSTGWGGATIRFGTNPIAGRRLRTRKKPVKPYPLQGSPAERPATGKSVRGQSRVVECGPPKRKGKGGETGERKPYMD